MKNKFKSFHKPSEAEFKLLWQTCIFIVDTNVLLNLYRYSIGTRNELFKIFESLKERLWLPYQAGMEFYKNRIKVILDQQAAYDQLNEEIESLEKAFKAALDNKYSRHSTINTAEIKSKLTKSIDDLKKEIQDKKLVHPDLINNDEILDRINTLFENRVGDEYEENKLKDLYKSGEIRFKEKIPPGYEDAKKDGNDKFGDFIIWSQIIDKAKNSKKPIIFITDDRKEDWWNRVSGKTIGPKPELINEIYKEAQVDFYMYQSDPFIEYAARYLKNENKTTEIENAINEIKQIRREDESKTLAGYIYPKEIYEAISFQKELEKQKQKYSDLLSYEYSASDNNILKALRNYVAHEEIDKIQDLIKSVELEKYTDLLSEKDIKKLKDTQRRLKLAEILRKHKSKIDSDVPDVDDDIFD